MFEDIADDDHVVLSFAPERKIGDDFRDAPIEVELFGAQIDRVVTALAGAGITFRYVSRWPE